MCITTMASTGRPAASAEGTKPRVSKLDGCCGGRSARTPSTHLASARRGHLPGALSGREAACEVVGRDREVAAEVQAMRREAIEADP